MDLVRDVLDKQIVHAEQNQMGRADGVVLTLDENGQPRVESLELGFEVLAERIHPRVLQFVHRTRERWSVRQKARYRIDWSSVDSVTRHHIQVNEDVEKTPAFEWERWLREHVVEKIPGSRQGGEK